MLYFVTKGIDVRLNWDPLVRKILRCPMVQALLLNETLEGLAMGWEYLWRGEIGTVPCFRDTGEDSFPVCLHTLKSLFGTSLHCVKVGPELKEHLEVMLATAGMQLQRTLLSHFYSLASFSCEENPDAIRWTNWCERKLKFNAKDQVCQAFKWLRCQPTRNCYPMSNRARPQNSTILGFLASRNCQTTNTRCCGHSF